jgi:hypothetical protein
MAYGLRPGDQRDILAAKFEVTNKEVFHLKNLYKLVHEWLEIERWETIDNTGEVENLYWERVKPDGAKEHHIWWRCQKIPENNRYYRYFLKIDFQTLAIKDIEIMFQGHKMETNKGEITFRIEAWLQLDFRNEWQDHWFLKHFDKIFRERVYKKQKDSYKNDLYNEAYMLQHAIKQYLKLKTPFERPRLFREEKGMGGG